VVEHNLAELDIERDGLRINIKGLAPQAAPLPTVIAPKVVVAAAAHAVAVDDQKAAARGHLIPLESPMVGVFFRAASPDDAPFVNVGDIVRPGQSICMIEAMKVFNEVPAEHAGRVVDIVVDNGKLVHQGDPLIYLEPL